MLILMLLLTTIVIVTTMMITAMVLATINTYPVVIEVVGDGGCGKRTCWIHTGATEWNLK